MDGLSVYSSLTRGIKHFHFGGEAVPCPLLLTSDMATPVAVGPSGHILIAASQYGKGRIVVVAHEMYVEEPRFGQFLLNAIDWLKPQSDAWVGVCGLSNLAEHLSKAGVRVKSLPSYDDSVGVFCCTAYNDKQPAELVKLVKEGGGLLIAGQAWHWCYTKPLQLFPGNKLTSVAGISFTPMYGEKGQFKVTQGIPPHPVFVPHNMDIRQDLSILLEGVTRFNLDSPSVPSALLVHGSLAFPIAQDESGQVFLAAARYGCGSVVVVPHEAYLSFPPLQSFVLNAVRWLHAGRQGPICVHPDLKSLHQVLCDNSFSSEVSSLKSGASVYCCTSYSDAQAEEIHCFVAEGGGLLIGGHAWWWAANTGFNEVAEYPGNKILNRFGISILKSTVKGKVYKAPTAEEASEYPHFRKNLFKVLEHVKNKPLAELTSPWMSTLSRDISDFLKIGAHHSSLYNVVVQSLTEIVIKSGALTVSLDHPVERPAEKFVLNFVNELYNALPDPGKLTAVIPIQKLETIPTVSVTIDGSNKGDRAWRSTGLYVSPGKQVTVCVPSIITGKGWEVQIGCHTDNLQHLEKLKRAPVVTRCFLIDAERVSVSSLWGGLLYIIIPSDSHLGSVEITLEEAVRAPYFKLGVSSVAQWQSAGRHYPAPWAELEADSIILTVPSKDVRHMDNPQSLLYLWNRIMEAVAKLAGCPSPLPRPERIVTDIQISAGWLHSGYPIMGHLESVREITQVEHMQSEDVWGPIHELGHNQQRGMWEFPPHTTEATCNLWSVYVHEEVLGTPRHKAHGSLRPTERQAAIKAYIEAGSKLDNWSVWTCLETYLQLQEGFGWKPFIQLFSEYRAMPHREMTKEEKMNLWAEKFSKEVKMNLVPFFKAWGWPIDAGLSEKLSDLPPWNKNPMDTGHLNRLWK